MHTMRVHRRLGQVSPRTVCAFGVATVLLGLIVWLGIAWFVTPPEELPDKGPPLAAALPAPDPRLSYDGPYKNIHPDVPYVADSLCASCHEGHSHTWSQHPMARTLMPIAQVESPPLGARTQNPFEARGQRWEVVVKDGKTWHTRTGLDAQGKPLFQQQLEAQFAIGSGAHAYSYLTIQEGVVLQTPITWYRQKNLWDLSPGFAPNMLAGRRIGADCLYCHSNGASENPRHETAYDTPIFPRGHGIGCQRCHGPGGEHVKNPGLVQTEAGFLDPTIVNPAHLSHSLREAICWQCHLEGEVRVLRRGRQRFDFRPGMPLEDFISVFEDVAESSFDHVVNHVEQMLLSRCYLKSAGRRPMGCATCHDPHEKPPPDRLAANYQRACLKCHQDQGCALPRPERLAAVKDDQCVVCHMPAFASGNVTHVSTTDHRIPRKPTPRQTKSATGSHAKDVQELVSFFAHQRGKDDPELDRDRALAGAILARNRRQLVRPLDKELEAAARRDPGDMLVRAQWGLTLLNRGQSEAALPIFQDVLARQPAFEWARFGAALSYFQMDELSKSADLWRRLVKEAPSLDGYRRGLMETLLRDRKLDEAVEAAHSWIAADPGAAEPHAMLRDIYRRLGRDDEAAEQERLATELTRILEPARNR